MGTRHLIAVYQNGVHKIAQYGQWDGYPAGQGRTVLEFLNDASAVDMLRNYWLKNCRFLSAAELEKPVDLDMHPQLSRNLSADILNLAASVDRLALVDSLGFAADSLFCEWAYVIDFDTNVLEVYKGFNTTEAVGRFKDMPTEEDSEYKPVTLIQTYPLDKLPTVEQLVADCDAD